MPQPLLDISITASKIRGVPKGRPGFNRNKNAEIKYPAPLHLNMFKMYSWLSSGLERNLNRDNSPRLNVQSN